ncbi:MAG: hypothetical protein IJN00_00540, partial [Clostridia bacterium]|nr:hypothetical protein [Clostridia bacterium]
MNPVRYLALLLVGLMLLPLAACAKPVTEAGSSVIDIPVETPAPTETPALQGSVPTAAVPEATAAPVLSAAPEATTAPTE